MEVYVDGMIGESIVKKWLCGSPLSSLLVDEEPHDETQSGKITFSLSSGKFLSHIIGKRGIEAMPDQLQSIVKSLTPSSLK